MRLLSDTGISLGIENGSSFQLGNSSVSISAQQLAFSVPGQPLPPVLSLTESGVSVGAAEMEVTGSLGASLGGPLETGTVQSPPNSNLQLQSLSGGLVLTGAGGLRIEDSPGSDAGVSVTSNSDLTLSSQRGQVRASSLSHSYVSTHGALVVFQVVIASQSVMLQGVQRTAESDTYEVCVCGGPTAQLYLVPATSNCLQHNAICTT